MEGTWLPQNEIPSVIQHSVSPNNGAINHYSTNSVANSLSPTSPSSMRPETAPGTLFSPVLSDKSPEFIDDGFTTGAAGHNGSSSTNSPYPMDSNIQNCSVSHLFYPADSHAQNGSTSNNFSLMRSSTQNDLASNSWHSVRTHNDAASNCLQPIGSRSQNGSTWNMTQPIGLSAQTGSAFITSPTRDFSPQNDQTLNDANVLGLSAQNWPTLNQRSSSVDEALSSIPGIISPFRNCMFSTGAEATGNASNFTGPVICAAPTFPSANSKKDAAMNELAASLQLATITQTYPLTAPSAHASYNTDYSFSSSTGAIPKTRINRLSISQPERESLQTAVVPRVGRNSATMNNAFTSSQQIQPSGRNTYHIRHPSATADNRVLTDSALHFITYGSTRQSNEHNSIYPCESFAPVNGRQQFPDVTGAGVIVPYGRHRHETHERQSYYANPNSYNTTGFHGGVPNHGNQMRDFGFFSGHRDGNGNPPARNLNFSEGYNNKQIAIYNSHKSYNYRHGSYRNKNWALEGNDFCKMHNSYLNRFYALNQDDRACAICVNPVLGNKLQSIYKNVIDISNLSNTAYRDTVNTFNKYYCKLNDLIGPYRNNAAKCQYMNGHKILPLQLVKVPERIETELRQLIFDTNTMLCKVSNLIATRDVEEFNRSLSTQIWILQTLEEKVDTKPKMVNVTANDVNRGIVRNSYITGPFASGRILQNTDTEIFLVILNKFNKPRPINYDLVRATCTDPCGGNVKLESESSSLIGVCQYVFRPTIIGEYKLDIEINNEKMPTKHARCVSFNGDTYPISRPAQIIGPTPANSSSQFDRLWGIHFTADGHILLSDRGQNKVYILTSELFFKCSIGMKGIKDGEFRTPTKAISIPNANEEHPDILVVDKDNDRMQLFTWDGAFKCKTRHRKLYLEKKPSTHEGATSSRNVQENSEFEDVDWLLAPWDACVTEEMQILCSDTRKSRIMMFDRNLVCTKHIQLPSSFIPRGLQLGYLNHLIVCDFQFYRIAIIFIPSERFPMIAEHELYNSSNKVDALFRKKIEFSPNRNQNRFQGLSMDSYGLIHVCDSRKGCLVYLTYSGNSLLSFHVVQKYESAKRTSLQDIAIQGNKFVVTTKEPSDVLIYYRDD